MKTLTTKELQEVVGGNLLAATKFKLTPTPMTAPTLPIGGNSTIITVDPETGIATCGG